MNYKSTPSNYYFFIPLLLSMNIFFTPALAMMPVIDVGEIVKTTEVINQLNGQYQSLQNQYHQLKAQYQSITGNYGWGNFENSLNELQQDREWSATDWQSALQGIAGGNAARYHQLLQQYQQANYSMNQETYAKGTDANLAQAYENQVATNQTSATQASYEFENINSHLTSLYKLGQEIEDSQKNSDLKSSMDLNSRIELEVGYIEVEELHMQTVLNEQTASIQASQIATENEAAEYNQAGDN
ncbi:MAG: hypothetical protein A3E87_06615 [Gammaproteobacteria bacterium RIFCSPHIGHO2_12_FULL_35_23]|nr:MAG: hypothetical protein A3E87_06615 [Gammaproteobacteria bacterium RIFCSPHIGHO2_12_FULL_35_23]